jgi:hypothetical protein
VPIYCRPIATRFETTLRKEIREIAKRLDITESKAFAVWYGKVALRLAEQEALEAASYDGGNDRGADFIFVDDEWERVVIAQWKYYSSSAKSPSDGDLAQLFNVPNELADAQDLRNDGRADLAEAAEALAEARDRHYSLELHFVYPGKKHKDRDRDPTRLVRNFNSRNRDEDITAQIVRLDDLEVAYDDYKGSSNRVQRGSIDLIDGEVLEEEHPYGRSFVATVPGSSLAALFEEHGNRLFDENVRLFLGARKRSVNAGIKETLEHTRERANFWAYNNGITIVARTVEADGEGDHLKLVDFSIVNGCQTTVSIAEASDAAAKGVSVVARIIAAEDPDLIEKIIRYTNSQTPINVWDISARDKLQQRLRKELDDLEDAWFYALRRGDWQAVADKSKYGKHGKRRVLQFPLAAQYLAAYRGMPIEAYKEKALLFTTHKSKVFRPDTDAQDLLWAWAIGQAVEQAIPKIREELIDDEVAAAILKRGAKFFVTSVAAQLLADRNGTDYVANCGVEGLFAKAMGQRLLKYAMLGTLLYVGVMRSLVSTSADVGTLIRRPETADQLRAGVNERLISERLAPAAFEEKLPKLPGVA